MNLKSNRIHRLLLFVLALPAILAGHAERTFAQETPGTFIPSECMFEGLDLGVATLDGESLGFACGYVVVPERHAAPDGPTIRLPVAVRRAANGAPDPLLMAQGGPGGDAFQAFSLLTPNTSIAADRDIVIFNQRGTPYASPELTCVETDEALDEILVADTEEGERLYTEALQACYRRLQTAGVDLSAYNSLENAADVPLIARALGYETYNFYGVSYGTLLGLHLMRNHPEGLRSVILDSVVPTDINFIAEVPKSENRVYGEIFTACEADSACREEYPDLEARFFALVDRFDREPVTLSLVDPETGERHEAFLDGRGLRSILYQLLYVPRMSAVFPKLVHDLEQGDLRYLEAMYPLLVFDQLVSEGMYYSVVCAEDADIDVNAIPLDTLRPEIARHAQEDLQSYIDACKRWVVDQLAPDVDAPVSSDIPTLLLSGRFDPVTPPPFAATAAAGLTNATVLVDSNASHGVALLSPCVNDIVADFLNDPTAAPDASCLDDQPPLAFVPPDAITLPLLGGINSLKPRTLALFGLAGLLLLVVLSPFFVWPIVYAFRALGDGRTERAPDDRRIRWASRIVMLLFGALAFVFAAGLTSFMFATLADQTLATALALPPSAAVVLWLPLVMLGAAVGVLAATFLIWSRRGSGSTAGKVYYTIVALCAVALILLIGSQGLLSPPL